MAINRVHDAITANLQKTISVKDGSVDWSQVVASIGERKDVKLTLGEVDPWVDCNGCLRQSLLLVL